MQGRALIVSTGGDPRAPARLLVVGCIHGNETAGVPVVDRLLLATPPQGVALLLVRSLNPDGEHGHHQHLDLDLSGGDARVSARYAARTSMRAVQLTRYGGSVTSWQNTVHPGSTATVVEFAARVPGSTQVRHAAVVLARGAGGRSAPKRRRGAGRPPPLSSPLPLP